MGHNPADATKNIGCMKDEEVVDHKIVQEILFGLQEPW